MNPETVATEAFAAREIRLPFARDEDGDSPAVHVAVSASGERVVVLRRDGADGVVYDVGADRLRALPALGGGEIEGLCALRHAPVAIAWWNDGDDLLYVAIDLERGALDGPWLVAGGATLVVGPDDVLRVLRRRPAAPSEPPADSEWPEIDALLALAESFVDGPGELVTIAAPGAAPELVAELAEDIDPYRSCSSPDGRWIHERPSRLRLDGALRLVATAGGREDVVLTVTAGLRSALVAFSPEGDRVLVSGADGRELRLLSFALPAGELLADTRFDAPLFALWPAGPAGVVASWVDELLVWRDARTPAAPVHLAQPGGAGLSFDLGVGADPSGAVLAASDGASLAIHRLDALARSHALPHAREVSGLAVAGLAARVVTVDGESVVVTALPLGGPASSTVVFRVARGAPGLFGPASDAAGRRLAWCLTGAGNGAACLDLEVAGPPRDLALGQTASAVAVHPSGELVAVSCGAVDSTVTISRWSDLAPVGRLTVENVAYALAFSGDGRRLAVASRSGELSLWDLARGAALARATAPLSRLDQLVAHVAFGPVGATFLTHGGVAHRLGDDGAVALDALAIGGTPSPSAGGRVVATRIERHRVRLARLRDGALVCDLLVEGHDEAALLADGRLVTLDTAARTLVTRPCPEAVDPAPPAAAPALQPVGADVSWASPDVPPSPLGLSGPAAHQWRALRRALQSRGPSLGYGDAEVEELVVELLPRVARALVAVDALARLLALFELGHPPRRAAEDAARARGARLREALADGLPAVGRFFTALEPKDLDWSEAEWALVAALVELDEREALAFFVAELGAQLAFEGGLCRRRDALPRTRPSTVAALRAAATLPAALGVATADLGGVAPDAADALVALVSDPDAPHPARAAAALILDLREDGPGPNLVAVPLDLLDQLEEIEEIFTVRGFVSGLGRM